MSTERPQFEAMNHRQSSRWATTSIHTETIGSPCREQCFRQHRNYALKMCISWVSMVLGLSFWKILGRYNNGDASLYIQQFLGVEMLGTTCLLCPKMNINGGSTQSQRMVTKVSTQGQHRVTTESTQGQRSVNDSWYCSFDILRDMEHS